MTLIYLLFVCCFGLYAWREYTNAVLLTIVLLPTYLLRLNLFGIPTTVLELLLVAVIGIGLFRLGLHKHKHLSLLKPIVLPTVLILLGATIGLFVSPDLASALGVYKAYFLEPIAFGLIVFVLLTQKHLTQENLFSALGVSAILVSLVAIIQWFIPSSIPIPWDFERRVTSIFDFPNAVGLYLAPIIALAWTKSTNHPFWLAVSLLGSLAIVLAQSEAAIIAVAVSVFLFFVSQPTTRKQAIVFGICAVILIGLSPLRPTVIEKLTLQDTSGQVRISQWNETWKMLLDRPLFGAGLSGFTQTLAPYHQAKQYEIFQYPHNEFLNTWSELGLIGLIGFLLLCVTVLQQALTSLTNNPASLITFFPLLTLFIHGLVDVPFFKNDLSILTILFLILFWYATQTKQTT